MPKRNKYNAIRCEMDGHKFDSKKEMRHYAKLKLLEKAGKISELKLQPAFILSSFGRKIGNYRADFSYFDDDGYHVVDVKGVKTAIYKWKKKHVLAQYGIEIEEV